MIVMVSMGFTNIPLHGNKSDDFLFKIERSRDSDEIIYEIKNTEVELSRIYIRFENRSFWFPSISSVELFGKMNSLDDYLAEVVNP